MSGSTKFSIRSLDDTAQPFTDRIPTYDSGKQMEPWNIKEKVDPEPLFSQLQDSDQSEHEEQQRQQEYKKARARGEEDGKQAIEEMRKDYGEAIARLDDAARSVNSVVATDIVDLALAVATEIIGHAVSVGREQLLDTIEKALASMPADQEIEVKLNPIDHDFLCAERFAADKTLIRLSSDEAIVTGGCEVISNHRVVDATVGTRLQTVRDALIALLSSSADETASDELAQESP